MTPSIPEVQSALADADVFYDREDWQPAIQRYVELAHLTDGASDGALLKLRARALRSAGAAAYSVGDLATASEHLHNALVQYEALRDAQGLAEVQQRLGQVRRAQGDPADALRLAELAKTAFVRAANRAGEAKTLFDIARANVALGNNDAALQAADGAVQMLRSRGNSIDLAEAYWVAGDALLAVDRVGEAAARYRSALAVAEAAGDLRTGWAMARGLAKIALKSEDTATAEAELRAGLKNVDSSLIGGDAEAFIARTVAELSSVSHAKTEAASTPVTSENSGEHATAPNHDPIVHSQDPHPARAGDPMEWVRNADQAFADGDVSAAFETMFAAWPSASPSERVEIRTQLLIRFASLGDTNPSVTTARRRLATLLFM